MFECRLAARLALAVLVLVVGLLVATPLSTSRRALFAVPLVAMFLLLPGLYCLRSYQVARDKPYHFVGLLFSAAFIIFCLSEMALQYEMIGTYNTFILLVLFVMVGLHQRVGSQVPTGQPHAE